MNRHIGLVIAILAAMVAAGCGSRDDLQVQRSVSAQADLFFSLLEANEVAEAYGMLADASREGVRLEEFKQLANELGFTGNQGVAWEAPYVDDDYAKIEGVVTTRDGARLPQELIFFREGRKWVLHIVRDASESESMESAAGRTLPLPDEEELSQLAMSTLASLAEALQGDDFTAFHRSAASVFQEHLVPEQLQESFEWLASPEVGFDWSAVPGAAPVFDPPPALDAGGLLSMKGHVPAGGQRLEFELQYVHEPPAWRLVAIHIRPPL